MAASAELHANGGSGQVETRGTRIAKYGGLAVGAGGFLLGFEKVGIVGLAVAGGGWGVEKLRERRQKRGGLLFARNAPVYDMKKAA